jgi:hypothetical protein
VKISAKQLCFGVQISYSNKMVSRFHTSGGGGRKIQGMVLNSANSCAKYDFFWLGRYGAGHIKA